MQVADGEQLSAWVKHSLMFTHTVPSPSKPASQTQAPASSQEACSAQLQLPPWPPPPSNPPLPPLPPVLELVLGAPPPPLPAVPLDSLSHEAPSKHPQVAINAKESRMRAMIGQSVEAACVILLRRNDG